MAGVTLVFVLLVQSVILLEGGPALRGRSRGHVVKRVRRQEEDGCTYTFRITAADAIASTCAAPPGLQNVTAELQGLAARLQAELAEGMERLTDNEDTINRCCDQVAQLETRVLEGQLEGAQLAASIANMTGKIDTAMMKGELEAQKMMTDMVGKSGDLQAQILDNGRKIAELDGRLSTEVSGLQNLISREQQQRLKMFVELTNYTAAVDQTIASMQDKTKEMLAGAEAEAIEAAELAAPSSCCKDFESRFENLTSAVMMQQMQTQRLKLSLEVEVTSQAKQLAADLDEERLLRTQLQIQVANQTTEIERLDSLLKGGVSRNGNGNGNGYERPNGLLFPPGEAVNGRPEVSLPDPVGPSEEDIAEVPTTLEGQREYVAGLGAQLKEERKRLAQLLIQVDEQGLRVADIDGLEDKIKELEMCCERLNAQLAEQQDRLESLQREVGAPSIVQPTPGPPGVPPELPPAATVTALLEVTTREIAKVTGELDKITPTRAPPAEIVDGLTTEKATLEELATTLKAMVDITGLPDEELPTEAPGVPKGPFVLPPGVTLPPGLLPPGVTIGPDGQLPPGIKLPPGVEIPGLKEAPVGLPPGVTLPPGLLPPGVTLGPDGQLPPGITLPPGVKIPGVKEAPVGLPPGVTLPPGLLPPGVTLGPDGQLPPGITLPPGVEIPGVKEAPVGLPPGVTLPPGLLPPGVTLGPDGQLPPGITLPPGVEIPGVKEAPVGLPPGVTLPPGLLPPGVTLGPDGQLPPGITLPPGVEIPGVKEAPVGLPPGVTLPPGLLPPGVTLGPDGQLPPGITLPPGVEIPGVKEAPVGLPPGVTLPPGLLPPGVTLGPDGQLPPGITLPPGVKIPGVKEAPVEGPVGLPPGVTLPPGLLPPGVTLGPDGQLPPGITLPPGVKIPGVKEAPVGLPPGVTLPPGLLPPGVTLGPDGQLPPGITLPPGVEIPGVKEAPVGLPPGVTLPPGLLPPGVTLGPDGQLPPGITLPPGVKIPGVKEAPVGLPPGVTLPPGLLPPGVTLGPDGRLPPGVTLPPGVEIPGVRPAEEVLPPGVTPEEGVEPGVTAAPGAEAPGVPDGPDGELPTSAPGVPRPGVPGTPGAPGVPQIEAVTPEEIDEVVTRLPGVRPTAAPGPGVGVTDVLKALTTAMIEQPRETTAAIKAVTGPDAPGVVTEAAEELMTKIEEATKAPVPGVTVGPTEAPAVATGRVILTTDEYGRPVTAVVPVEPGVTPGPGVTVAPGVAFTTPRPDFPTPRPDQTAPPDYLELLRRLEALEKKLESQAQDLQKELEEEAGKRQDLEQTLTEQKGELGRLTSENEQLKGVVSNQSAEISRLQLKQNKVEHMKDGPEVMPTCADWKRAGFKRSGNYTLDPDSPTCGVEPFEIYCDMTDCTTGVSVIHHDSEERTLVQGCEEPGCFSQQVNYELSMAQIRALMARSSSCEQYIRYECYGSVLLHDGQNEPFGWWVSRDGQKMTYWGGAEPGSNKCACGEQGNCAGGQKSCNCDKNDLVWRSDEGMIRDIEALPVTRLHFGDTGDYGGGSTEKGYFTLGPLRCRA